MLIKNSPIAKQISFVSKNNSYSSHKKSKDMQRKRSETEIEEIFFRKQDKNNISNHVQNYNNTPNITAEKY
jgi:hypothetical protein